MSVWEDYAQVPIAGDFFTAEPVQQARAEATVDRCLGTVLDVGAADGHITRMIRNAGHHTVHTDISHTRCKRAHSVRTPSTRCDGAALPFRDACFDTVVLGEVLEHLDNPGPVLTEACRVARERVVVSLPLHGWADPTHKWRISLDVLTDPVQREAQPTNGTQIVLTFQRGDCWPPDYWQSDPSWAEQFGGR